MKMNTKFNLTRQPFSKIIQEIVKLKGTNDDSSVDNYFNYDENKIEVFNKRNSNDKEYIKTLESIKFNYTVDPNDLSSFIFTRDKKESTNEEYFINATLSFIAWYLKVMNKEKQDYTQLLIRVLFSFSTNNFHRILCINILYFMLKIIMVNNEFDVRDYSELVYAFYSDNSDIPKEGNEVVVLLIDKIVNHLPPECTDSELEKLFNHANLIVKSRNLDFFECTSIISIIEHLIKKRNRGAMNLFVSISNSPTVKDLQGHYIDGILNTIYTCFPSDLIVELPKTHEEVTKIPIYSTKDPFDFDGLLPDSAKEMIIWIVKEWKKSSWIESVLIRMWNKLDKAKEKISKNELLIASFAFVNSSLELYRYTEFLDAFFNSVLFDENIYISPEDDSFLGVCRNCVFSFMIDNRKCIYLHKLIDRKKQCKLLITEYICRITPFYTETPCTSVLTAFTNLFFYHFPNFIEEDKQTDKELELLRSAMLEYYSSVFKNDGVRNFLFKSKMLSGFYSFIYSEQTRDAVLYELESFIEECIPEDAAFVINDIKEVFDNINEYYPKSEAKDRFYKLAKALVNMIYSATEGKEKEIPVQNIITPAFESIKLFKEDKLEVFSIITTFLNVMKKNWFELTNPQIQEISDIIIEFRNEEIFNMLYDITFEKKGLAISSTLVLLFLVFEETEFYERIITKVESLIVNTNGIENEVHKMDQYFIEYMKRVKKEERSSKFVNRILSIIVKCESKRSSESFVSNFISLLTPVENKYISTLEGPIINALTDLILSAYWKNSATGRIGCGKILSTHQIYSTGKHQKFEVCIWIRPKNKDKDKYVLVEFTEGDLYLLVYYKGEKIGIELNADVFEFSLFIKPEQWSFVAIEFDLSPKNNTIVSVIVNENEKEEVSVPKIIFGKETLVKIGSLEENDSYVEVGNVLIGKKLNKRSKMFYEGPITTNKCGPGLEFLPSLKKTNIEREESFAFLLTYKRKIDLILPIFGLFAIQFKDKSAWNEAPSIAIDILTKLILLIPKNQQKISESNTIQALAALLNLADPKIMNYNFYRQLHSLYQMVQNKDLKKQIFVNILINLELWIGSSNNDLLKILRRWHMFIEEKATKDYDYYTFINSRIKIYFSTKYIPINKKKRNSELDIEKCRAILCELIIKCTIPQYVSLEDNYHENVSYNNTKLTKVLHYISKEEKEFLNQNNYSKEDVRKLYNLFKVNNEKVTVTIIDYVASLFSNGYFPINELQEELDIIIGILDVDALSVEKFFNKISDLLIEIPELISVCCWYCYETKKGSIKNALEKMQPKNLSVNETMFIWPLVYALTSEEEESKSIIRYIFDNYIELWESNYILTTILAKIIGADGDIVFRRILSVMQEKIIKLISDNSENGYNCFNVYATLVSFHIFFIKKNKINSHINVMFGNKDKKPKYNKSLYTPSHLFYRIRKFIPRSFSNYVLGMATNSDGTWKYEDIAISFLKFTEKIGKTVFLTSLILACRFLSYSDKNKEVVSKFLYCFPEIAKKYTFKEIKTEDGQIFCNDFEYIEKLKENFTNYLVKQTFALHNNIISEIEKSVSYEISPLEIDYEEERDIILDISIENIKKWKVLWSFLSIEGGPWFIELPKSEREAINWKRDNSGCFAWCPAKIKRNKHVNNYSKEKHDDNKEDENANKVFTEQTHPKNVHRMSQDYITYCNKNSYTGTLKSAKKDSECQVSLNKDVICIFVKEKLIVKESYDNIEAVYLVPTIHMRTSLNIFFFSRENVLIDFKKEVITEVLENLKKKATNSDFLTKAYPKVIESSGMTKMWSDDQLSNFEYLLFLNRVSGRNFSNVSQYPIFPWVLVDYDSEELNLSDEKIFRDLTYPIGALDQDRRNKLINKMEFFTKSDSECSYMYSSGPISILAVCLYLVRLEPFTEMQFNIQSGKFESKDRQLLDIKQHFNMMRFNNAEFWELTPEFYFQPEFLVNINNYDLNGSGDIGLPKWAKTPIDFIYKHRKALESKYVSQHLNKWIDLVWGYKQKDKESLNVYDSRLYEDVWEENKVCNELKTLLRMVGQIPAKLFKTPHVDHKFNNEEIDREIKQFQISNFIFGGVSPSSKCLYTISFDKESNAYVRYKINEKLTETKKLVENEEFEAILKSANCVIFNLNGVLKIIRTLEQACLFNCEKLTTQTLGYPFIGCKIVIYDQSLVLIVSDDDSIYLFKETDLETPLVQMQTYRDGIICAAVSQTFSSYAIGTQDKSLLIGSSSKGNIEHSINIDGIPNNVVITNAWGFVVVSMTETSLSKTNTIAIYTINGQFVRKVNCIKPETIFSFRSVHGFDYITVSGQKTAKTYEVYPMRECLTFKTKRLPDITFFDRNQRCLITIETNGTITQSYPQLDEC